LKKKGNLIMNMKSQLESNPLADHDIDVVNELLIRRDANPRSRIMLADDGHGP
jgi:hypothetical protein